MFKIPKFLTIGLGVFLVCGVVYLYTQINNHSVSSYLASTVTNLLRSQNLSSKSPLHEKSDTKVTPLINSPKPTPVNWLTPTGGTYPKIGSNDPIWVQVSKEKQRVYIMKGNEIIYTMICSTGLDTSSDTSTPVGTFHIQKERGTSFYNSNEKEGAMYWVSWKNHGEFLFHSVATDKNGNVIPSEAVKLGQKASHGCIRLAVPDAKWFFENIKYNTTVVIS
jgi:lipoprotein-anchoring transpeptidase ErfK/SrfK